MVLRFKGEGERGELVKREKEEREVGKWVRMLQTELEGGRGIHNSSGETRLNVLYVFLSKRKMEHFLAPSRSKWHSEFHVN